MFCWLAQTEDDQSSVPALMEPTAEEEVSIDFSNTAWMVEIKMVTKRAVGIEEGTSDLSTEEWVGVWPAGNEGTLAGTEDTADR